MIININLRVITNSLFRIKRIIFYESLLNVFRLEAMNGAIKRNEL